MLEACCLDLFLHFRAFHFHLTSFRSFALNMDKNGAHVGHMFLYGTYFPAAGWEHSLQKPFVSLKLLA